ncbi:site-specific integrase [Mucilaginibacter psychrotolerans]|uniref:Integrase n=1 Tax=Mucilaginibacter psychrotolerans TaxID=1524096 RepID=A0A4Y8S3N3_9SPHI|nr:site-specific integrase [Mucilaginibacter psychrotolerans]TFF33311.1 integrase [Mucilaginibacter psychrotolerans]
MATAKIITWSRPDKDGQYPIGIKIWCNGKPSYIFEGHTLPNRDLWDAKKQEVKKSFPNAARLTNYLSKKLSEARDKALRLETDELKVSAQQIKATIRDKANGKQKSKGVPFKEIADQYLKEQFECGNRDVYLADKSRLVRFYEFSKNDDLPVSAVNADFLHRYTVYLRKDRKRVGNSKTSPKPLSERTIINHLLIIRTLWNRAITAKAVSNENYPFGADGKILIKFPESIKIGLNEVELNQLETLDLSDKPSLNHARNVCLVGYYFAGMRITDTLLLKWSDFQNGRLYYKMSKNGEPGSLKMPAKAAVILEQYKSVQNINGLVFPDLNRLNNLDDRMKLRKEINTAENRINKAIKVVMTKMACTKNISPHKFRHSFAQRAEEMNVSPKVLQRLYRHESINTTMIYQSNFSHQKADEALDAVVGF